MFCGRAAVGRVRTAGFLVMCPSFDEVDIICRMKYTCVYSKDEIPLLARQAAVSAMAMRSDAEIGSCSES